MSSDVSPPLVSRRRLSGLRPSTGMMSFATLSHDSGKPPSFFIGMVSTNFAILSLSLQHVFCVDGVESLSWFGGEMTLKMEFDETGTLVRSGDVTMEGGGVATGAGGWGEVTVTGTGFAVVVTGTGFAVVVSAGTTTFGISFGRSGGSNSVGGWGKNGKSLGGDGGEMGPLGLMNTFAGGSGSSIGETLMSAPLQPSGKKYRIFPLLCSSSSKSPTKEAFLQ